MSFAKPGRSGWHGVQQGGGADHGAMESKDLAIPWAAMRGEEGCVQEGGEAKEWTSDGQNIVLWETKATHSWESKSVAVATLLNAWNERVLTRGHECGGGGLMVW